MCYKILRIIVIIAQCPRIRTYYHACLSSEIRHARGTQGDIEIGHIWTSGIFNQDSSIVLSSSSHGLLCIIIQFLCTVATFQILNSHIWLMTTILHHKNIDHFHHHRKVFFLNKLLQNCRSQLGAIFLCRRYLATSGDNFGCHNWSGRGQG